MKPATHQTVDGTLLWADNNLVYAQQTNAGNSLTRQSFVTKDEATPDDEQDCNTIIVSHLPHVGDYDLIPY